MHVATLCLGALALKDASGYEIKKMFDEGWFSQFQEASYGSIYPALTRLTEEGLITCEAHAQEGRPDKKVYSITEDGRAALQQALNAPLQEDKFRSEFLFVMLFADLLPQALLGDLIDDKIREYGEDLSQIENGQDDESPGFTFVKGFGRAVCEAAYAYLQENRHLVEDVKTRNKAKRRADLATAPAGD